MPDGYAYCLFWLHNEFWLTHGTYLLISFRAASLALEQSCITGRRPHDKMAEMLHIPYSKAFSWVETFCILLRILMKFALEGPIDNRLALVWLVLDEQFINGCLRHQAWMHNCFKFFGSQNTNKSCFNHSNRINKASIYQQFLFTFVTWTLPTEWHKLCHIIPRNCT